MSDYTIPGLAITDRFATVPLDWAKPQGAVIEVFFREVVDATRRTEDLPLLCFLQGGPGGKSPRPGKGDPTWLTEALKTHRVVLPDQRGTGRSTPVSAALMESFPDGEAAADYLSCFRADSIVRDFDHIRRSTYGGARWTTLGQSYGGFLTLTYLSLAPEGLAACHVTGGLASVHPSADVVYRHTYPRVASKNAAYYRRYPADAARIGAIADRLAADDVLLPDGDRLSVRRFQTIGLDLGMKPGLERIHWLIDEAFAGSGQDRFTDHFLDEMMQKTSYHSNPLFAVLQESIYGEGDGATSWSAHRIRDEFPAFDPAARPLLFTGEMIYPWMFEEIASLRPYRAGAEALAARPRYSRLYDLPRLASNEVPVSAVIYHDDMYVDEALSRQTAAEVGNLDWWITNEFEHDGLRQSASVFARLTEMLRDRGGPLPAGSNR
jgi:proline iminopeptidase